MFGGAHFHHLLNRHIAVNNRIWIFNFDKLEWSILNSLTMPRTAYFHAAAMNEVERFEFYKDEFIYYFVFFSVVKFGFMEVW